MTMGEAKVQDHPQLLTSSSHEILETCLKEEKKKDKKPAIESLIKG